MLDSCKEEAITLCGPGMAQGRIGLDRDGQNGTVALAFRCASLECVNECQETVTVLTLWVRYGSQDNLVLLC